MWGIALGFHLIENEKGNKSERIFSNASSEVVLKCVNNPILNRLN